MIQVQALLAGVSVFSLFLLLANLVIRSRITVLARLRSIQKTDGLWREIEPLNLPFSQRVIRPSLEKLGSRIGRLAPRAIQATTARYLTQAGHPGGLKTGSFLGIMGACALAFPMLAGAFVLAVNIPVRLLGISLLLAVVLGILGPWLWLSAVANSRVREIELALPDAIDLLVVGVEAGLSFDMALAKMTEKMDGPLPQEFARTLNEIRLGKLRRKALHDMANRVGSRALSNFLTTVNQGTQMGIPLGGILRIQSDGVRQERRQRAEEQAMKAPIKMLFPLVFFIFPALFVVLLGPAAIQIVKTFQQM